MSTHPHAPPGTGNPARRFVGFWLAPADPTTLGFIRVVTGCLVLYTHLAYSVDLANFFGKDAWYDQATANRERREFPNVAPPLGWEDPFHPTRHMQLPDPPHRRAAVAAYLDSLLDPSQPRVEVEARLAFLSRAVRADAELAAQKVLAGRHCLEAVSYLAALSATPVERQNQLAVLMDESQRAARAKSQIPDLAIPPSPGLANALSGPERAAWAREAEAMFASLPASREGRDTVCTYFYETDHAQHEAFFKFVRRVAAADAPERARTLDYLNYWNVDPAICTRTGEPFFSLWFHLTDPAEIALAHCACLVVFFLFTIGFMTRVTSVLAWLAAASYLHRSVQIVFGMDTMMMILLLYLMVGNSGAALSVDRLINRYRAVRLSLARSGTVDARTRRYLDGPALSVSSGFALRLIQVHFCFIYMASGLAKLQGPAWWNTNAFWDTLANPEFTMIYYEWYEGLLRQAVSARPLYAVMAFGGVAFTFICEIGLPFIVWTRHRPLMVILALCLHTGIGFFMGLVVFSLFMMTMLLAYLPGVVIRDRLFGPPGAGERLRLSLPAQTWRQQRAVALVLAADLDGHVDYQPAEGPIQVVAAGRAATGPAAVPALMRGVPWLNGFRFLARIPAVVRLLSGAEPAAAATPKVAEPAATR